MVDMSATLLHHGHIRLIHRAAKHGDVVIGLTTDEQILAIKGYVPEISYQHRKEILESIIGVDEVVPTPWLISEDVLNQYSIDLLVHGDDNSNPISEKRLLLLPRTEGVSSSDIRQSVSKSLVNISNKKLMLTPGPAAVLYENIRYIKPLFGRGDSEYQQMEEAVVDWIKGLSGQDNLVIAQGSATFAIELALHSFVTGRVLLVSTGFYSDRMKCLLPASCSLTKVDYEELGNIKGSFDWVLCAHTETSTAFKVGLEYVKERANNFNARFFVDSTGSIGLEDGHELCDVTAFSSCKGLLGLTGAAFIAYKQYMEPANINKFYFNLNTHKNHQVTGPYHAIASLYGVMDLHFELQKRVVASKRAVMEGFRNFIPSSKNQPLLCTYVDGTVKQKDANVILYTPRSKLNGSVICHLGEVHSPTVNVMNRIDIDTGEVDNSKG